jgi:ATP-dependent RNA helicase RhlE
VAASQKFDLLKQLLADEGFKSAIVFSRTKHRARRLAEQLSRSGHQAIALQGNMTQAQRDRAMEGFRKGRFDVLVATDIAARGIDVDHISHVINYDMPATMDAYTHRIGRTGRSERSGKAYSMFSSEDLPNVHAIERKLGPAITRRSAPGMGGPVVTTRVRPARRRRGLRGV